MPRRHSPTDLIPVKIIVYGDAAEAAKWLPWAKKRFAILDNGKYDVFTKRIPVTHDVMITLERTRGIRTITIVAGSAGGLIYIPTVSGVANFGWGTPYTDENRPLGTPTSSSLYGNYPYVISPTSGVRAGRLIKEKTLHFDKPYRGSSPQAYGTDGAWAFRNKDAVTWYNGTASGRGWGIVAHNGNVVFITPWYNGGSERIVAAGKAFGILWALVSQVGSEEYVFYAGFGETTFTNIATLYTEETNPVDDFIASSFVAESSNTNYSISPSGQKIVCIGSNSIIRVTIEETILNTTGLEPAFTEEVFDRESFYFPRTLNITDSGHTETNLFNITGSAGALIQHGANEVVGHYGWVDSVLSSTVSDQIPQTSLIKQIGLVWEDEEEVPIISTKTVKLSLTCDHNRTFYQEFAGEGGGGPDWEEATNDFRQSTWLVDYTMEERVTGPGINLLVNANYYNSSETTVSTGSSWVDEEFGVGATEGTQNTDIVGTHVEITSDFFLSDDASVYNLSTRKVTKNFTVDTDTASYNGPGDDFNTTVTEMIVNAATEYTDRTISLQGNVLMETPAAVVNASVTRTHLTSPSQVFASNSSLNDFIQWIRPGTAFRGNNLGPYGCAEAPYPVDFSVVQIDPADFSTYILYPSVSSPQYDPILGWNVSENYVADPPNTGVVGWGKAINDGSYTWDKEVTTQLQEPSIIDDQSRHRSHDPSYVSKNNILLYQNHESVRSKGDVVADENGTSFITEYPDPELIIYLTGITDPIAYLYLSEFDEADISLKELGMY